MENATKALLIAGSILIAILLIAIGMRVFSSTSGTTDSVESTMSSTEIATFNNKFTQYVGTRNKAQVMALLNVAISNNATIPAHKVTINGKDPTTVMNNVSEGTHTVTIHTYDNGYVKDISVSGV